MSIQIRTNSLWRNWQAQTLPESPDSLFHSGWESYPPAFVSDLPDDLLLSEWEEWVDNLRLGSGIETLIVTGIGGSSLGGKAIRNACKPYTDRLVFWEGPHPIDLRRIGKLSERRRVAMLFVSKSGNTLETRANYEMFRQFFPEAPVYFVTSEPERIREFAGDLITESNTFLIPERLGGRYSVLSPVGILPGLFIGADMRSFVRAFYEGVEGWDIGIPTNANAAKSMAIQLHNLILSGFRNFAFWIYAAELRNFGDWLVQLWGESLGKAPYPDLLPLVLRGPEDQHSLLQYFMAGPNSTVHMFLHTETYGVLDTVIPLDVTGSVANHSLFEILSAENRSVQMALTEQRRPVAEMLLPEISMDHLGRLMCFWMHTVSYLGYLLRINPFDQPGVEAGKVHCKRILRGMQSADPLQTAFEI